MIKAITLDLDDTLWPVLPTLYAAEAALSQWLSKHAPASEQYLTDSVRGQIRSELVSRFPERAHDMSWLRLELLREGFRQAGDDPDLAEPAFDNFLAARQQINPYAEVHEVLAGWSKRYPLVAISNGNANIHRVGMGNYFTAAISAHEQDFAKPDLRMFHAAASHSGVPLEQTLHIGDDWHMDIEPALNLGMQIAWVKRADLKHKPLSPTLLELASKVPVFENLREIDQFLQAN